MNDIIPAQAPLALAEPLPLDQNPAAVYLAGLGNDRSRRTQRQALDRIAALLLGVDPAQEPVKNLCLAVHWAGLRFQHTQLVRARLAESYSPASANRMLAALRRTLRAAWRLGQMSAEDYQRAADLDPVIGSTVPAGRELTPGELQAIKQACRNDPSPAGARDNGLIGVAYSCGLRRAELAGLDLESYEPEAGRLLVLGKRSKERYVPVNQGLALALGEWLAIRGSFPGALFWPVNKAGKLTPRRLTPQAIYLIMARRAAEAGVAKFSPHDLRRTCAGDLLARGGDTLIVARFLGHSDPKTTARYDLRPWEAVRKAGELLHW